MIPAARRAAALAAALTLSLGGLVGAGTASARPVPGYPECGNEPTSECLFSHEPRTSTAPRSHTPTHAQVEKKPSILDRMIEYALWSVLGAVPYFLLRVFRQVRARRESPPTHTQGGAR